MTTTKTATRGTAGLHHRSDPARYANVDGRLMRAARLRLGLSAPRLLERIKQAGHQLTLSGLTRIERGGRTQVATANAIAAALGLPVEAFAPAHPAPATPVSTPARQADDAGGERDTTGRGPGADEAAPGAPQQAGPAWPEREFWTPEQAAREYFQIASPYMLIKGVRDGSLPHTRCGRAIRFSRVQLEQIAAKWSAGPSPEPKPGRRASRTAAPAELASLAVSPRSARRHAG